MNADAKNAPPKKVQNQNRRPGNRPANQSGKKPGNNYNRNKNSRNRNRNRGPNQGLGQGPDAVFKKYINFLDQHLIARKKYFGFFFRSDPNQKIKLEKVFYNTLNQLRNFEDSLKDEQKAILEKIVNGLELDCTYSKNHDLKFEGEKIEHECDFDDPHYLPSQIEANFMKDNEESVGSIEDYKRLKGL